MSTECPSTLAGRREEFPIDSFRHLEGMLQEIRKAVMDMAASLADRRQPEQETYRVERQDVDEAIRDLILQSGRLAQILGIESGGQSVKEAT